MSKISNLDGKKLLHIFQHQGDTPMAIDSIEHPKRLEDAPMDVVRIFRLLLHQGWGPFTLMCDLRMAILTKVWAQCQRDRRVDVRC